MMLDVLDKEGRGEIFNRILENFGIFSKDGKWIIENEGVKPDYDVEMTPKDVILGFDPQLQKAVQVVLEELKTKKYTKTARPKYPVRKRQN